jgi:uncharacterized protein (DUF488 family)
MTELAGKEAGYFALQVFTIGHSTISYESFHALLRLHHINAVADIRTSPFSRYVPQFNKSNLQRELRNSDVKYVFLGDELGGRPKDKGLYLDGVADYERMAQTSEFARGIARVVEGAKSYRIALMCAERDPLDCHRCLLVGRALHESGMKVHHILSDGQLLNQERVEDLLLDLAGKTDIDLFDAPSSRLVAAYRDRARKIAFAESQFASKPLAAGGKKHD